MTPFEHLAFAFIAGWIGCCVFIFLAEWLTDIRQSLPDPMAEAHGDVCPWPEDFKASHSTVVTEKGQPNLGA